MMNCQANEVNEDDKDSVISERCWEEKYRGHSRKWLMRDGSTKNSRGMICSTMKETYPLPEHDERPFKGIRRTILEQKMLEEVAQEIIEENKKDPPVEEYCTEYDGNFNYPGYDPNKEVERDTELYLKHPLYTSEAASFWKFRLDRQIRGQSTIPGLTATMDVKKPFKKNSEFSKPISEVLDNDVL